jgi:hypothetical protein
MTRIRIASAIGAVALAFSAVVAGQIPAVAHEEPSVASTADLHSREGAGRSMADLRRDLAPYKDVDNALADGFVPVSECTESPAGGMGVHFLNPARAMAPVDPQKPAILVYLPTADGGYELVAAEWFHADSDQDLSTDRDRPSLWGRPFDGPMLGHEPGMPIHYDLHVWLFKANPAGVFAPWNPSVSC